MKAARWAIRLACWPAIRLLCALPTQLPALLLPVLADIYGQRDPYIKVRAGLWRRFAEVSALLAQ